MNHEVLGYIVLGGIIIGGGVPLVWLFIHTMREIRKLDEEKRKKEARR